MTKVRVLVILICLSVSALAQQASPSAIDKLSGIDPVVGQLLSEWKVPGLALGIVQDSHVILARGYGYRNLEDKLPFTPNTLFGIGSTTKSFTALALAILKDRGKLDWDDPVRKYLPSYQLQDPVASERMTLRDLLLHRSGLARHDLVWYSSDFTMPQILDRLRYLQMGRGFRNAFDYNNIGYMTAGYLAGQVYGKGWETLVRETILVPLGMNATNFHDTDSEKTSDYALPYDVVKDKIERIPFASAQGVEPAGAINSTLNDMLRYSQMLLAKGKFGSTQIVSEANLSTIQSPQILMGRPSAYSELSEPAYGMAWVIQTYRGHRYVWHNGGIDGFYTLLTLLPDDHIAVVVFTNRLDPSAAEILARNVFDRLLGLPPVDWDTRYKEAAAKAKVAEAAAEKKQLAERVPNTHPSHPLDAYTGRFENPGYGTVTITLQNGHLEFALNRLTAPLEHFHYDVFTTSMDSRLAGLQLRFQTGLSGGIESVAAPLQPGVDEIVFRRAVAPATAGGAHD